MIVKKPPMMHAVRGHTDGLDDRIDNSKSIRLLLNAGADVNAKNCLGKTALMITSENGFSQQTHILIPEGADVNKQDMYRDAALMLAVKGGHVQCLKFIIQAGAAVNIKNMFGETGLILAIMHGHIQCVDVLIQSGANVNLADGSGLTPLQVAAGKRCKQCVDLLIKAGAHVNILGGAGDTTLSYALKANDGECMKLLIEAGADRWGHGLICKLAEKDLRNEKSLSKIKGLLYSGASVNIGPGNALTSCLKHQTGDVEELALLLFAAGEELNKNETEEVPDYLKLPEQITLMHLCRESIRKHLLQMSKMNLLVRVPKLGLPSEMTAYILHGIEAAPKVLKN